LSAKPGNCSIIVSHEYEAIVLSERVSKLPKKSMGNKSLALSEKLFADLTTALLLER
jgi:hypothetical protein